MLMKAQVHLLPATREANKSADELFKHRISTFLANWDGRLASQNRLPQSKLRFLLLNTRVRGALCGTDQWLSRTTNAAGWQLAHGSRKSLAWGGAFLWHQPMAEWLLIAGACLPATAPGAEMCDSRKWPGLKHPAAPAVPSSSSLGGRRHSGGRVHSGHGRGGWLSMITILRSGHRCGSAHHGPTSQASPWLPRWPWSWCPQSTVGG